MHSLPSLLRLRREAQIEKDLAGEKRAQKRLTRIVAKLARRPLGSVRIYDLYTVMACRSYGLDIEDPSYSQDYYLASTPK